MGSGGYPGWTVTLDPPQAITGRVPLDLNDGPLSIGSTSGGAVIDWGTAQLQEYLAQQGQWGSNVSAFTVPNRTVSIPLGAGMEIGSDVEDALMRLQEKVGLLQMAGGVVMRQRAGGRAMYADIVGATVHVPDGWGETGGVEPDITLTLECLPDFYGDEIVLDQTACTGLYDEVLTVSTVQADIEGAYPARTRIIVTDTSGQDQHGLMWGIRSRHYDAAATAALFYEAEALTPLSGASVVSLAGASGGQAVQITPLPGGSWVSMLSTQIASGDLALTHVGSYAVWARVFSSDDTPNFRLMWGNAALAAPVTNPPAEAFSAGDFYLLNLGAIRLDAPPVGLNAWAGVVQVMSDGKSGGTDAAIDCLYLQPIDDGGGQLTSLTMASPGEISTVCYASSGTDGGSLGGGGVGWQGAGNIATPGDFAVAAFTAAGHTDFLLAVDFGFAVPSSATITGVEVQFRRKAEKSSSASFISDYSVRLYSGGVLVGTDHAAAGAWSSESRICGSPTDAWGLSLTPADVNAPGFGFAISAVSSGGSNQAYVFGLITMTVYYTLAGGFEVVSDAVVKAGSLTEVRSDGAFREIGAANVYGPVSKVTGDLPRLPASGMEGRPVEVLVRPTVGDLDTQPDSLLAGMTVQVAYRPCWIVRP